MKYIKGLFFLLLFVIAGFMLTAWLTSLSVPKASGLAGPGIVVGYGLFGAVAGLIIGIVLLTKTNRRLLSIIALAGLILTLTIGFFLGYKVRSEAKVPEPIIRVPVKPAMYFQQESMGLGIAYPKILEKKVIYFYNPNLDKTVDEHIPYDSLTIAETDTGPEIAYAPPWFYPEIMKIDYGILVFKVASITKDWIQVEVNKQTKRTAWLSMFDVDYVSWEKFILRMNSVEQLNHDNNPLRARPFAHGSPVVARGSLLVPVEVRDEWLRVNMVTDDYKVVGSGWIRWRNGTQLLISYSLLS